MPTGAGIVAATHPSPQPVPTRPRVSDQGENIRLAAKGGTADTPDTNTIRASSDSADPSSATATSSHGDNEKNNQHDQGEDGGQGDACNRSGAAAVPRHLWFRGAARLPELEDRVWDARLIRDSAVNKREAVDDVGRGETKETKEGKKRKGKLVRMGLVAVALAHNSVEVRTISCTVIAVRVSLFL